MIAIRDMEMPTHCGGCKFYIWDYLERNGICLCNNYKHVDLRERDKDCPLVPCIGIIRGYKEHKPKFDFDDEAEE